MFRSTTYPRAIDPLALLIVVRTKMAAVARAALCDYKIALAKGEIVATHSLVDGSRNLEFLRDVSLPHLKNTEFYRVREATTKLEGVLRKRGSVAEFRHPRLNCLRRNSLCVAVRVEAKSLRSRPEGGDSFGGYISTEYDALAWGISDVSNGRRSATTRVRIGKSEGKGGNQK